MHPTHAPVPRSSLALFLLRHWRLILGCPVLLALSPAGAQTKLKLTAVIPGSERVQLVYNGDFQFQGPFITNTYPLPEGWWRQADIFTGAGTNMVLADNNVVAQACVNHGAPVCKYQRTVSLQPNTDYVLSAYLWNFGDSANHVIANVDLNDAAQDPQLSLRYSDPNAAEGYFIYRSFNTTNTGSIVTLRVFYDSFAGTGAASAWFPVGAQWDNVAITRAAEFSPPQASSSGANLRPVVSISSPADGTNVILETVPAALPITASAFDFDGTIDKLELFTGPVKLGEASASPYTFFWTNPGCGPFQFTAVATDNRGTTTLSAPVGILIAALPHPVSLSITSSGDAILVSWPTSATASALQSASNLSAAAGWTLVSTPALTTGTQNVVTVPKAGPRPFFRLGPEIDPGTMERKLLMGYQGWFACPQDGSQINQWVHWFRNNAPYATNATVDFWPDITELDADELFSTGMTLTNGSPAQVYSAFNQKTVLRHFKWMKDNHLDGVFLQRFSSALSNPAFFAFRNQVTVNVRIGADTFGRVFAIMYDISGQDTNTLVSTLTNDWAYLVNGLQITNSPQYLRHRGKPLVAIWGFGFKDRPGTPEDAQAVISFFKAAGCTVMGGVPTYWSQLKNDSQTNTAWAAAYRAFDVISPWSVGRYTNEAGADAFRTNLIMPDLTETAGLGLDYVPVIWPGFSWHNLKGDPSPLNQIPRNGGGFYWRQVYNAIAVGCTMLYGAMFDEMDEGTAMFKLAPTANELPVEGTFVPVNADGWTNLPSDWYLRLAGQATKMLRGEIPVQSQIPITP